MAPLAAATVRETPFVRLINHWYFDPLWIDVRVDLQKHRRRPPERGWLLLRARLHGANIMDAVSQVFGRLGRDEVHGGGASWEELRAGH